jgi:hypothetical protein
VTHHKFSGCNTLCVRRSCSLAHSIQCLDHHVAVQAASAAEAAEAHQEAVEVGLDEGEGAVATMRGLHPKLLVSSLLHSSLNTLVAIIAYTMANYLTCVIM